MFKNKLKKDESNKRVVYNFEFKEINVSKNGGTL